MGNGMKKYVELIIRDRLTNCKRWHVFSEEECSFSVKEAKKNDYEYGIGKLEMMTEGEKEEENGAK